MKQNKNIKHVDGDSIFLRLLQKTDATVEYTRWLNSKKINQFLESRFIKHTKKDVENYIKQMNSNSDLLFFAIIRKDNQRHIGNIKLGPINKNHNLAEIGIMIGDGNSWGRGFATEAIKVISDVGFNSLKLHKITAGAYEENTGSIKAFLKAGFFIDGINYQHFFYKDRYVNKILFGKINYNK